MPNSGDHHIPTFLASHYGEPRGDIEVGKIMIKRFQIGDHVSWNSEAGRVSGFIISIHTSDFVYKGHIHHASEDDPQYEIKSDKTDHIAAHKAGALHLIGEI